MLHFNTLQHLPEEISIVQEDKSFGDATMMCPKTFISSTVITSADPAAPTEMLHHHFPFSKILNNELIKQKLKQYKALK